MKPFNFLATGISYIEAGLDMKALAPLNGVNLAQSGQDIFYSYQMAKYVLEHNKYANCKVALIGLTPYSFEYDSSKAFSSSFYPLYYYPFFYQFRGTYLTKELLEELLDKELYYKLLSSADENKADLNHLYAKLGNDKSFSRKDLCNILNDADSLSCKDYPTTVSDNIMILSEYIKMLKSYHIAPVICVLPFSKMMKMFYNIEKMNAFKEIMKSFQAEYSLEVIDLWNLEIDNECFSDLTHLNPKGSKIVSEIILKKLNHYIN